MKYQITGETNEVYDGKHLVTLYRIKALKNIPKHGVKMGDIGGWIQDTSNLSHEGNAWINENSMVFGGSVVKGDAIIKDSIVTGKTEVSHNASILSSQIRGKKSVIKDDTQLFMVKVFNQLKAEGASFLQRVKVEGVVTINSNMCSISDSTLSGRVTILAKDATIKSSTIENVLFNVNKYVVIRSSLILEEVCDIYGDIEFSDVSISGKRMIFHTGSQSKWCHVRAEKCHRIDVRGENELEGVLIKGCEFRILNALNEPTSIKGNYDLNKVGDHQYEVQIDESYCVLDAVQMDGNISIKGEWFMKKTSITGIIKLASNDHCSTHLMDCKVQDCVSILIPTDLTHDKVRFNGLCFSGDIQIDSTEQLDMYIV